MSDRKKIVFIVNHEVVIYNFRKELVEKLINLNYEVYLFSPKGAKIDLLVANGCKHIKIDVNRHGVNPFEDAKLFTEYYHELKKIRPDIIFTYTIKPNVYGGIAASILKIPFFSNVTGLGTSIEDNNSFVKKVSSFMYRHALKKAEVVFFQNENDMSFFTKNKTFKRTCLLPGSGVNLNDFPVINYPVNEKTVFLFLSRIMKEKGIDEFLNSARQLIDEGYNVSFEIAGFIDDENYKEIVDNHIRDGTIKYHGQVDDVRDLFKYANCLVLPSYHEGMSNVLLEAAASARPLIASNIPGCREVIDDEINGFLCDSKNSDNLISKMKKFCDLTLKEQEVMGLNGRYKVENEFDRKIVISKYIDLMKEILK